MAPTEIENAHEQATTESKSFEEFGREIFEKIDETTCIFDVRKLFCYGATRGLRILTP